MTRFKVKIVQFAALAGLLIAGIGVSAALAANGNGPPTSPPGQGECQHGNSGHECRPDPQPQNGKDCEVHGQQGGVNEDHCLGTNATTTHGTTTAPTTTHGTTTTRCDDEEFDCTPTVTHPATTTTPTHPTTTTTPTHPTTTTTPTHPTTTGPTGCDTNAGKDGHPGNDDCAATTTTTTTHTTTTTTPVTTATVAGTTTTTTTTTTSAPGTTTTSTPSGGTEGGSVTPTQEVAGAAVSGAKASAGELPFTGFPAWILALAGSALVLAGLGIRRFAD
jgi:hypothetical protein